jgi:hypothetical protein
MDSGLISDKRWYAKEHVGLCGENSGRRIYGVVGLDSLNDIVKRGA